MKGKKEENKFSKTDMERMGIFKEMGYVSIGHPYSSRSNAAFNESASKGRQLLAPGTKIRDATALGYFSPFDRILEGEAYLAPMKLERDAAHLSAKKNLSGAFIPSSASKDMNGYGTYYGTFSGTIPYMTAELKAKGKYKAPGKNFLTNPGKKGTGFGYADVTFDAYPKYDSDSYERPRDLYRKDVDLHRKLMKSNCFKLNMYPQAYFTENPYRGDKPLPPVKKHKEMKTGKDKGVFKPSSPSKLDGGMKAGTFSSYPTHSDDAYKVIAPRAKNIVNKSGKTYMPNAGPKSVLQPSILATNVDMAVNSQNYKTLSYVMTY